MDKSDGLAWPLSAEDMLQHDLFSPQSDILDTRLRIVCTTDHFFVIVGVGAFVSGYLLVITKTPRPSLAAVPQAHHEELSWLIDAMAMLVSNQYNRNVVCFEHGMCGCSNAENAHLHIMPVSKQATAADFKAAIDQVLDHRSIGITDEIDRELKREFRSEKSNQEVWTFEQLPPSPLEHYPDLGDRSRKYVYFKSPFAAASFLTDADLGSQVGREIVFEVERHHNRTLQQQLEKLSNKGLTRYGQLPWRWQDFGFAENILETMHDLARPVMQLQNSGSVNRFGFQCYLKSEQSFEKKNQLEMIFSAAI